MTLSMAPLLIESNDIPATARRALRDARDAPPADRSPHLETAARSLYNDLGLDCDDARVLVGLSEVTPATTNARRCIDANVSAAS